MVEAITSGVEQYQLIRAEKDLLEKTLLGCIKVLADFLSAASPPAFARSLRIAHYVRHIAGQFQPRIRLAPGSGSDAIAAGLRDLGPGPDPTRARGRQSVAGRASSFRDSSQTAMQLLAGIPRLEPTAWIIGQQFVRQIPEQVPNLPATSMKETV